MFNKFHKLIAILIALAFLASCSDDDSNGPSDDKTESQILLEYVESTSDYVNTVAPAMIGATELRTLHVTGKVHIIDVRSEEDYNNQGHIEGAVHVPLTGLLEYIKTINTDDYEKIAVTCYSGQSASYGVGFLRLLGYDNVFAHKFGMSSWSQETKGPWTKAISNARATQFTADVTEKAEKGELPVINTGKKTGAEILEARVQTLLSEGYTPARVSNADVFGALDNYYIVNYWPLAQYLDPGHIPGAIQYTPKQDLALETSLKTLPTDKTIVVYCYTGQTSSHVTAYLRALGYDAKSLLYGANGMIYDIISSRQGFPHWTDDECLGYDVVK